jgi:exopolyphosphatase
MISPDDLLFFPEVDLKNLPDPSITLVDHNTPPMDYTSLVDEIIDHHQDSESVVTCSRTIELVGSCSTLVAQKLLNRDDYTMTQDVATLLLAAILIDTGDLKAEGRCTHWDVDVSSQLKPLCHIQDLYNRVLSARENLNALTGLQILRKDFKKSSVDEIQVGFSSACILITELAATRLSLPNDMEVFANQEGLHLLVLLGIDMKPLRRQIALYQPPNLPPGISHDLTDSIAANLELDTSVNVERIGEGTFDGIIMEQGNTSLSRKQLMPMIINCLASGNVEQLPEDHHIVKIIEENNHLRPEMEETPSHQGSLLQLESISVRLGESLDSLALAQDSDDEHRPSSLTNMYSLTSVDDQMQPSHPLEPEPPLEPEIVMLSPPAVLPEEIEVISVRRCHVTIM